ncbi:hypothetical protein U9M48_009524 [Paspalum notatum var. saurae]|uniref:Uncharacterized protein n=1 Tax=Paspalum notatum var. saurae TaxID=547442 RepID=A0AAQ3SRS7_PASNO
MRRGSILLLAPRRSSPVRRKKKTAHHEIEEPTRDLPLIEKPDDKWNPEHEDDVSPSWPSP